MESILRESQLPIDSISPNPLNPRKRFDEEKLEELAESIKQVGILQPLIVAEDDAEPGKYHLIAGERRLKAAKMAGLDDVPVIYRHELFTNASTQAIAMLIENLQREDLDPIEEAQAFKTLTQDHSWKQVDLAEKLGISQSHIANRIRLLVLPESVQEGISQGTVTATVGKELATYAKVPGVNEAIDEAMADKDVDNLLWTAKHNAYGNIRPLHEGGRPEPQFDTAGCVGCKKKIMMPGRWGDDREKRLPWCTDIRCWSEKQEAALHVIAERAKQQAIDAGEEIIELNSLPRDAYGSLDGARFNTAECTQCEHRRQGRDSWMDEDDEPDDVCINPACFQAKQAEALAAQRRRAKELKAAHDERKEQLIAAFYPEGLFDDPDFDDFQTIIYMTVQVIHNPPWSSSLSKAKVEAAVYERYGWDKPEGLGWSDEVRHLVRQLATLTVSELLRLIYFVMLMPTGHDDGIFRAVYGDESAVDDEAMEEGDDDGSDPWDE